LPPLPPAAAAAWPRLGAGGQRRGAGGADHGPGAGRVLQHLLLTLRLHNLQRQGAFVTETFAGVNTPNATLMFRSVRIPMRKRSLFAKPDGFIPPHDKEDEMNKHTATTALAAAFALALSGAALAEDPMSTAPEAEPRSRRLTAMPMVTSSSRKFPWRTSCTTSSPWPTRTTMPA